MTPSTLPPRLAFVVKLASVLAFVVGLIGPMNAAENAPPQTLAELEAEIEKALRLTGTPGAAIAIVSRDKVEWVKAIGWADVATKKPATTKTLFRLGSVSKGLVALAALKLQEEGKLKLTDTLRQWVPECPIDNPWEATDPIRLEHLLEHTSGLPEMGLNEYAHSDPKPVTMAESLAFDPSNRRVRWRPGTRKAYSNYGVQLAAAAVEKAAGKRFEDYVRDEIFLPLGMTSATYFPPSGEPGVTSTYRADGQPVPYSHALYRAAGSVNASAEDMANYVRFHLQRGSVDRRQIVGPESMDRLEVPRTSPAARVGVTSGYGLQNGAGFSKGHEWHGHGGEIDGAHALMGYVPELGFGRAILINADNRGAIGWIRWLVDGYLERGIKEAGLPPAATLSSETVRELAGCYANLTPRVEGFMGLVEYYAGVRRVTADDKGMTWQPLLGGPAERWVAVSDGLFRRPNATKPALGVVRDGTNATWLQDDNVTLAKISAFSFWSVVGGVALSVLLLGSATLFAVVWGARRALGRLPHPGPLAVRACPLVGVAGLAGFVGCYSQAAAGGLPVMGTMNAWTVGMMLASFLIPLGAILGLAAAWHHRRAAMNRAAYWHSVIVSFALVFLTGFGLSWGIIGLRLWA